MLRVSDVMDKWKSRLATVTFDWRHVMETSVITKQSVYNFSLRTLQDLQLNLTSNEQKWY